MACQFVCVDNFGFLAGTYQFPDVSPEAAGDTEPAPEAQTDAATSTTANSHDAWTEYEYDTKYGGLWWHTSNNEQPTDSPGKRPTVSISSKLWYRNYFRIFIQVWIVLHFCIITFCMVSTSANQEWWKYQGEVFLSG